MKNATLVVLAILATVPPASRALAAPASQEEADRLKAVLGRYISSSPETAGAVAVSPQGSDYRASFDLKLLAQALEGFGVSVEPATVALVLAPNESGTWRVTSDAFPPLVVHYKGQTLTMGSSSYRFEGTFDPKLPGFSEASATQDGVTFDQDAPTLSEQRRIGHTASNQHAVAAEGGSANFDGHYAASDIIDKMVIRPPAPKVTVEVAPTAPATSLSYAVKTGEASLSADRLRLGKLLELWAFLVAHPNHDSLIEAQDELRGLLRSSLPLFGALKESGSASDLSLTTDSGVFSLGKLAGNFDLTDLGGAGRAALGFGVDGLKIPDTAVPSWAAGLLPTSFEIKPTVVGFHFDDAAKQAVEDFDLRQNGFAPAQLDRIGRIAWPGEGARLILDPSRITSALLDLRFEGEAAIGAAPAGHLTVTGTGLDKTIAALQSAAATDPSAAQLLAQFVLAKNLAKVSADGTATWLIETSFKGPVMINGVPLQ